VGLSHQQYNIFIQSACTKSSEAYTIYFITTLYNTYMTAAMLNCSDLQHHINSQLQSAYKTTVSYSIH